MRIIVDINHPAQVHLFKNFIWEMEKRGHTILVTASEKDINIKLLDNYKIKYVRLGSYGRSILEKLINLIILDARMYFVSKKFQPDFFIGLGSIRAAHAAFLLNKPSVTLEDTEHSVEQLLLYLPFTSIVLTPNSYKRKLGKKQIPFNGYKELAYLHPHYFKPDPLILKRLYIADGDKYVILRFVSWDATHDMGHHGLNLDLKRMLILELEKHCKVFITSESSLPPDLEKYRIRVPPEELHNVQYYATLYIGEGATMASESAILGTYAVYINTIRLGYLDDQERQYGLVYNARNISDNELIDTILRLVNNPGLKQECQLKRDKLLSDKIDVTGFLIDYLTGYPDQGTLKPHRAKIYVETSGIPRQ